MLENILTVITCIDSCMFFPVMFKILDVVAYKEELDCKDLDFYIKILAGINLPFLFI